VLVLVGDPVPTSTAGWQLRVSSAVSEASQHVQSRSTYAGEELLGPDDVRSAGASVAVLVANPVDGLPRPFGGQRKGFVGLATGLHDAGIEWVLLVPPLPDFLAAEVVARAVAALRAADVHPGTVLDLADEVRRLVRDAAAGAGWRHEAADDVLVVARSAPATGSRA
jgi:hypothetical protein